jgi:essential nuclear protein 1
MPRATAKATGKTRHDPLLVQLHEDDVEAKYGRVSKPGKRQKGRTSSGKGHEQDENDPNGEADGTTILDPKTSRKIFELARDQQVELGVLDEDGDPLKDEDDEEDIKLRPRIGLGMNGMDEEEEEEYEVEEYEIDAEDEFVSRVPLRSRGVNTQTNRSLANRPR